MKTYMVVRTYFEEHPPRILARGLSLSQAKKWCSDPETSSSTCQRPENRAHTHQFGKWFDGFSEER